MAWLLDAAYFLAAVLFIFGLKRMSSPVTARTGIVWAGVGMLIATAVSFLHAGMHNYALMIVAIVSSSVLAWVAAKRVAMTDMPQMIAIYNGMGGGAAACIAAVELIKAHSLPFNVQAIAVSGALIGSLAFSGSIIAFAKLQGLIKKVWRFSGQRWLNLAVAVLTLVLGYQLAINSGELHGLSILIFFLAALAIGILMTLPIGGADMPVVISLYNAMTGLAVGFEGYVLNNPAMMIAGIVVGASGTLLTQLMAKAMNRSIANVLFSNFGTSEGAQTAGLEGRSMKALEARDVASLMAFAEKVIIIPGYGMAVAQAQHKIWELTKLLESRDVEVKFAIHPVAGRMPGHMNVLLAEAGVPYDMIADLDDINPEFPLTDVVLIIGANDVVNPAARSNPDSPIYGMPILDADKARNAIVIKRGQGAGFSGIENELFYADNTSMCYGDGQKVAADLVAAVKELSE